jgi:hypothetical protein
MSTLTWNLSTAPATTPEYWLLFADGQAVQALTKLAPYVGPGTYSVDLTQIDPLSPMPSDGLSHAYSVALVGANVVGPQSASVSINIPPAVALPPPVTPPPPAVVWPAADSLTFQ